MRRYPPRADVAAMKQSLSRSQLYSNVDEQLPNTNFLIGGIGDGTPEGPHPDLCWNLAPFTSGRHFLGPLVEFKPVHRV